MNGGGIISRREEQTTKVVTGELRVNWIIKMNNVLMDSLIEMD